MISSISFQLGDDMLLRNCRAGWLGAVRPWSNYIGLGGPIGGSDGYLAAHRAPRYVLSVVGEVGLGLLGACAELRESAYQGV